VRMQISGNNLVRIEVGLTDHFFKRVEVSPGIYFGKIFHRGPKL
jgi:hypothetical protein